MVRKMKKKSWIILIGIIVALFVGMILHFALKPEKSNILKINNDGLLEKINQKDTFILLISQDGCVHCEEYKPILNRILTENNLNAYEIDWKELRTNNDLNNLFNINGTPTTIFINDGEEKTSMNRLVGGATYSDLKNKLKERGFIK